MAVTVVIPNTTPEPAEEMPVTTPYEPASEEDLATIQSQLGRVPRGVLGIGARCVCGNPTVVVTAPRLPNGTPFPTMYYLTHPAATSAMSTLEAQQLMVEMQNKLAEDPELQAAYQRAHEAYLADREAIEHVDELENITAGGMPTRVKCLHALAGHALAAGPGINPIGDWALEAASWSPQRCACAEPRSSVREAQ